ncbi:MAG: CaiB/BaiF CoA transferase family protein [Variibacter sp.]
MTDPIFAGLKVIDCASYIAAPAAATILSDFGADVIKIEPPGDGDPYRKLSSLPGYPLSEHNYCWMVDARNKRSLALDLRKPDGQKIIHDLAAQADVFITNYPLQVRDRLGVSYAALRPLNERLIYASFTGYGETGAEANKPGFDSNAYWARSGLMDLVRPDAKSPPARSLPGQGDHPSAVSLFAAIAVALYQRERTGKGTQVGTSLIANGVWSNACFSQAALCGARFIDRPPREDAPNAVVSHYQCADGRWLMLSLLDEDRQWPGLAKAIGREDLIADPRFANKTSRRAHARELTAILDQLFGSKPVAAWREALDAGGVMFSIVGTVDDLSSDAQMREANVLVPFADDSMLTVNSPLWIEGADKVAPRPAPSVGQHSDAVLRDAGYDADRIASLRKAGVVS